MTAEELFCAKLDAYGFADTLVAKEAGISRSTMTRMRDNKPALQSSLTLLNLALDRLIEQRQAAINALPKPEGE